MTFRFLALFTLISAAAAAQQSAHGKLLAVLEFNSKLEGADKKNVDAQYLADTVRGAVLDAVPDMRVMTRENEMVLLEGSGKKLSECEGECEVDTGRRLGADLVISGSLLKFGSSYKLIVKLHETHEGRLLSEAQASGRTIDELDADVQLAVRKLLRPLSGEFPGQTITPPPRISETPQTTTPRPGPAVSRTPKLTVATTGSKTYQISVRSGAKTFTCAKPVTETTPCELEGIPAGSATLVVRGDASREHDFNFNPLGMRIMVEPRGKWPLFVGLGLLGGGALLIAAGSQVDTTFGSAQQTLLYIYGVGLSIPGLVFLIIAASRSPVTYDETSGEAFRFRDQGKFQLAGVGLGPVPGGGAMASAAFRF